MILIPHQFDRHHARSYGETYHREDICWSRSTWEKKVRKSRKNRYGYEYRDYTASFTGFELARKSGYIWWQSLTCSGTADDPRAWPPYQAWSYTNTGGNW